jgi:transcriptional regulator with XRE-family HTH domain
MSRVAFVRSILATKGLSLAEVCRRSQARFQSDHRLWVSPAMYEELQETAFSPSFPQVYSLSTITGFRLVDWLRVFGFSLDTPVRLQLSLPNHQTCELDARTYDSTAELRWFQETMSSELRNTIAPLSRWLAGSVRSRINGLTENLSTPFRYFRIGRKDAYAYPDLLPGSIVRVDLRHISPTSLPEAYAHRLFAIEHNRGIVCARLKPAGDGRVTICPQVVAYPPIELKLGFDARLLGLVDFEFRGLIAHESPALSSKTARSWTPAPLIEPVTTGQHFHRARLRAGLSFQNASDRTRFIARHLRDTRYFCAASALSNLETSNSLPRHIHKLIALAAIYGIPLAGFLAAIGMPIDRAGSEVMPRNWFRASAESGRTQLHSEFLRLFESRFGPIPFFLRHALRQLTGLPGPSILDFFWAGFTRDWNHPYLKNAVLFAVNRRSKNPATSPAFPIWAQPAYLLNLRNGEPLCAACSLQRDTLVVHPCTTISRTTMRLKHHEEVEVTGQVVAVARFLS